MSAKPERSSEPSNHPLVKEFIVEYREAMAGCERSKATTDTDAWRELYAEFYKTTIRSRKRIAESIRGQCDRLEEDAWTEEDEKSVKDSVKEAIELREAEQHFKRQTVFPITAPVRRAAELWNSFQAKANNLANEQPMFGQEVLDELRRVYADSLKASFDETIGRVEIK